MRAATDAGDAKERKREGNMKARTVPNASGLDLDHDSNGI